MRSHVIGTGADGTLTESFEASMELDSNQAVMRGYQQKADELLHALESLKTSKKGELTIVQKGCLPLLKGGFLVMDLTQDIRGFAVSMCDEFRTNMDINAFSGFTDIGNSREFVLHGEETYVERLSVSHRMSPVVSVGFANGRSTHEVGFDESKDAAFCTVFPVSLRDSFSFEVASSGTVLGALGISDSAFGRTLDISVDIEIAVVSGWGLAGVGYGSTTNVLQDLYNLLLKALEPLLEPLRKLMEMAQDVMNRISEAMTMLTQYGAEFLELMYDALMAPYERVHSLLGDRITEVFCEQIIRISEQAEAIIDVSMVGQTVGFTYMGFTVKFTVNMATWEKYTKNVVKAEFSGDVNGVGFTSFVNVKVKGETTKTPYVTAGFTVKGNDWDLTTNIDPTMTTNKNLINMSGTVRGVRIDAVLPQAVQYNQIDLSLQDIPGIKSILSNIPSPIAGTKIDLDAGVNLKYNLPLVTGVIINEFESNPPGTDKDNEWAEILNLSGTSVDLNDWTLTTSKDKVHIIKDVKLAPGERVVIDLEGTFLLNTKEYLILKDPDGTEIDRSATMSDGNNDEKTCQRGMDGSTEWSLIEGTPGTANMGGIFGENGIANSVIKDIVKKAAVKAMNELKHVYTVEALEELFTRTVKYAVDDGINRIARSVVEGSIYVSVDFTDLTSTGRSGFRIYVMVDSDIVGDVLKYLIGKAEALFLNIDDPYNINIDSVVYDDVYVGVGVYGGIKAPSFLDKTQKGEKVLMGVDICCNLSSLASLLGDDVGTPKVKAQIGIRNCPYEMIPKQLGVKKNMTYDLWFIRMTFSSVKA
ncbi:MAG: lamin tail domain-containing protein [archaeon]|nr:lamin tail domain-containing protein [archaeon]